MKKPTVAQSIGQNIRRLRKEFNLTQEELARAVDTNRISITNIESGIHCTTVDKLVELCSIFCCSPNDLFPPIPKSAVQKAPISITFKSAKVRKAALSDPEFVRMMHKMTTKAFYMKTKKK